MELTSSILRRCFDYRMTHSVIDGDGAFPFAVSTAGARNPQYDKENRNCQDAVAVCITPSFVVGVVCDGCGGTHPEVERYSVSSNEVGAKLACAQILRDAQKAFLRKLAFSPVELVDRFSRNLMTSFKSMVKASCGRDEAAAEKFIFDFLMTTVVGFVVTKDQFVIFNSGDGVVALNGNLTILDSEAGQYFGNDLLAICCPGSYSKERESNNLKVFASGYSTELQSIFVASDGIAQIARDNSKQMTEFVTRLPQPDQCQNGFDFALQEFRRDIAWSPENTTELTDDATFALIRRVALETEIVC